MKKMKLIEAKKVAVWRSTLPKLFRTLANSCEISVTYWDAEGNRCTTFVTAGSANQAEILISIINQSVN